MIDYFEMLGISEEATPEQIQEAFDKKRIELIASIDDDQQRQEAITELQSAIDAIGRKKALALIQGDNPPKIIDPLLSMVDNVNSSLHNEMAQFATIPCVYCSTRNFKEALICSSCGRHISRPCPKCGKILSIQVKICHRCKTILREFDESRIFDASHVKEVKDLERQETQIRVGALEEHHQKRAVYGLVFWLVVAAVLVGLCVLTYFLLPSLGLSNFH
jgi:hypothetical protein